MLVAETDQLARVSIENDTLIAQITIPKDMHMAKQEDFVYVEADSVAGMKLGETIWIGEGHADELGIINYEKQAILKRQIIATDELKLNGAKFKVYVGYQMCFDTYCKPPAEEVYELEYKITPEK